jgi:hypothetical protein
MIIIRTRHRIESTHYWIWIIDISKEYYQLQKYIERLICTLAFELFIVSGLSELKANNLQWSVACIIFSQFLHSCHTSSRLPCVDSLFLFICGNSHMSQISSCNSMILRVRAQRICVIGCHHLCVIHHNLLLTSPSVECCQHVPSFANPLGIFFCSKLLNIISCGLMEALPKLLFIVVVLISTLLFWSCCCCLFFVDFTLCT